MARVRLHRTPADLGSGRSVVLPGWPETPHLVGIAASRHSLEQHTSNGSVVTIVRSPNCGQAYLVGETGEWRMLPCCAALVACPAQLVNLATKGRGSPIAVSAQAMLRPSS